MRRTGWALAGAATLGITGAVIGTQLASGAGESDESVFVSVTPCRLIDTRPAAELNVGPRSTKLGEDETALFAAHDGDDANSTCEIPSTATAIATNTVAIAPTARSFMTLFPGDVANPGTANLNYVAGQAPTPNAANIPLSATGTFNVFNAFGEVHVVVDVNGYYQPSTNVGATGPAGPAGADGSDGADGSAGASGPAGPAGPVNCLSDELIQAERWDVDPCRELTIATGIVGAGNAAMATANGKLYVVDEAASTIEVFDTESGAAVTTISAVTAPRDIAFDGEELYVTNNPGGSTEQPITVQVIDPASDAVVGSSIPIATHIGGGTGPGVLIVAAPGEMYIAHASGPIVALDTTTKTTSVTGVDPAAPVSELVSTGSTIYAVEAAFGTALALDTATKTGGPSSLPDDLSNLTFSGRYLYASDGSDIRVFDSTGTEVTGSPILLGQTVVAMAYDGTFIYASAPDIDRVAVVRTTSRMFEKWIPTTPDPGTIAFDGKNLFIFDATTGDVTKLLPY